MHGPGVDEHLGVTWQSGYGQTTSAYYVADGLGSITRIVDGSGSVLNQYRYGAFGKMKQVQESFANAYTYTGREWDADAGLYYYRTRWYDPAVGRFMSEDPIGFAGGDTNLFAYVLNNPVSWVDPLGLARGDWWDLRTYVALAFSTSVAGQGATTSTEGVEQETVTFFNLVGASLDMYIGSLPNPCDLTGEIGFGLGRHLGAGYFFGRPDAASDMEVGGLVLHFGIGVGTPVYVGGTFPAK